jgi:hypothetical protein
MRRAWVVLAALSLGGCGLFFGDRETGAGGEGTGASTGVGGGGGQGGGGGAAPGTCKTLRPCQGADTPRWAFTYAATSLSDLSAGSDGRIYLAGSAAPGEPDGLFPELPAGGSAHSFVGSVSESGCDLKVCDLGTTEALLDAIRLSHGAGEVHAVWTRPSQLCAGPLSDLSTPPPCEIACTTNGVFSDPGVGHVAGPPAATVVTFRPESGGMVTCNQASWQASSTTYAWSSASKANVELGDDVRRVRLSTKDASSLRVTGHCSGGLGSLSCPAVAPAFSLFTGELQAQAPTFSSSILVSMNPHTDPSITGYPAPNGWASTLEGLMGQRRLRWRDDMLRGDDLNPQQSEVLAFASAEEAMPVGADLFVASGRSDVDIGFGCPFGQCGIPFAFYGILTNDMGARGRWIPVLGSSSSRESRARGAIQLADGSVVVGGGYANGEIDLPMAAPVVNAEGQAALFLTRADPL